MRRDDERFEQEARRLFEQSVSALDGQTRSRVARARARALERRGPRFGSARLAIPAAAAAVALGVVVWQVSLQTEPESTIAQIADLEILLGEDDLEMLEDLEFYAWIDEQPEFAGVVDDDDGSG